MSDNKSPYIRPATESDSLSLSHVCLLTCDVGSTGEHLHEFGELPGLLWAEPYVHLPTGFGFVLVDPAKSDAVVGYVVGSYDTRAFEQAAEQTWYPAIRERFPQHSSSSPSRPLRDADARYVQRLYHPESIRKIDAIIMFSPAHLHINLLPEYQRQGWGRRFIEEVVRYLKEKGLSTVYLGPIDPRNDRSRKFYTRIGFRHLEVPPECGEVLGLRFEDLN